MPPVESPPPSPPPLPLSPLPRVERFFASCARGDKLCAIHWESPAAASPAGALIFCHGYGHYSGAGQDWLAAVLARDGVACFSLEHAGHGKSTGLRGYVPDFDALVADFLAYAATVRRALPRGTPLFIYGESLGGAIAQHAALRAPAAFSGLLLFAPMTGLSAGVAPPWPVMALGRLAAWFAPTAAIAPVRDIMPLCFRDPASLAAARDDPVRYAGRLRLGTAFALKGAMEALAARGAQLATPLLILHGTGDGVTSAAASEALFAACASRDKTLVLYEGAYHVLWTEPADTRSRLLADVRGWLADRCAPERRAAALRAAAGGDIAVRLTRPLGALPFDAPLEALLAAGIEPEAAAPFSRRTHGQAYFAQRPEADMPRDSEQLVAETIAVAPPRIHE